MYLKKNESGLEPSQAVTNMSGIQKTEVRKRDDMNAGGTGNKESNWDRWCVRPHLKGM